MAGSTINAYAREWADARREELFPRLSRDMAAKPNDTSKWMYNYSSAGDEPADLGYWIGAEICRSHYTQAEDKPQAIRDIVTVANVEEIVRNSQYAGLLK